MLLVITTEDDSIDRDVGMKDSHVHKVSNTSFIDNGVVKSSSIVVKRRRAQVLIVVMTTRADLLACCMRYLRDLRNFNLSSRYS